MAHAEAGSTRELKLAVLFVAVLAASGCGGNEPSSSRTHLVVDNSVTGTKTIDCPGNPLCTRLEKTAVAAFKPVSPRVACSQIYGGDATATVTGTLRGDPIDASFSLKNGCETARWTRLRWLLGNTTP